MLLYLGPDSDEFTDEHEGWVAGRFSDGSLSSIWTDVARYPTGTFSCYLARCECGWGGTSVPPTPGGHNTAERQWRTQHLAQVLATRPQRRTLPGPDYVPGGFVPER